MVSSGFSTLRFADWPLLDDFLATGAAAALLLGCALLTQAEDSATPDALENPFPQLIHEYQEDWFHLLERIHQPTLLVRAKDSIELPEGDVERMRSLIRNCRTVEVSRPDHHVYLSDRREFYSALDSFLGEP